MAKKAATPAEIHAGEILAAIRQLKETGTYPVPFRQAAETGHPGLSEAELREAMQTAPLKGKFLLAFDLDLDALTVLKEDAQRLAEDERLLRALLDRLCSQNFPIVTIEQAKTLVTKPLAAPFKAAWTARIAAGQLPAFVKKVQTGKKPGTTLLDARFTLPWEDLSKRLVHALRQRRERGPDAYPASYTQLIEAVAPDAAPELRKQARESEPARSQIVVILGGADELVCLAEDRATVLAGDSLFGRLLALTTSAAVPVTTLKKLATKLAKNDQSMFLERWSERVTQAQLPDSVAFVAGKKPGKPEARELHNRQHLLPWEEGAKQVVARLRQLRDQPGQGAGSYPARIEDLVNLVLPDAPAAIRKLALQSETYRSLVQELGTGAERTAFFTEDASRVAASFVGPALESLLQPDDQAVALDKLTKSKAVPKTLQAAFATSLKEQVDAGTLPPGIGALQVGKKWMLFRLQDIRRAGSTAARPAEPPRTPAPPVATPAQGTFAQDFEQAFSRLDAEQGHRNFVKLLDLRKALPQYDAHLFESGLRQLRVDRKFTLETSEGLASTLSDEERQAGIVEAGSRYLYCSRIR